MCVVAVAAGVFLKKTNKQKKEAGPRTHMWSSMEVFVVPQQLILKLLHLEIVSHGLLSTPNVINKISLIKHQ